MGIRNLNDKKKEKKSAAQGFEACSIMEECVVLALAS